MSAAAWAANWQSGQWSSQSPAGASGPPLPSDWTHNAAASPKVALSAAATEATSEAACGAIGADRAW